jgi:hypothetical protein
VGEGRLACGGAAVDGHPDTSNAERLDPVGDVVDHA